MARVSLPRVGLLAGRDVFFRFFLLLSPPPECVFLFRSFLFGANPMGSVTLSNAVQCLWLLWGSGSHCPPAKPREQLSWWGGRAIQPWPRSGPKLSVTGSLERVNREGVVLSV